MNIDAGLTGLGLQWFAGVVNTVTLWVLTTPAILVLAVWYGGGLEVTWTCLIPPYVAMNAIFFYRFVTFDWEDFSRLVREREEKGATRNENGNNSKEGGSGDDTILMVMDDWSEATEATPLV